MFKFFLRRKKKTEQKVIHPKYTTYQEKYHNKDDAMNYIVSQRLRINSQPETFPGEQHLCFVAKREADYRQHILANLLQANSNYIVQDPDNLYEKTKKFLESHGYNVYCLHAHPENPIIYNPFQIIKMHPSIEKGIQQLASAIMSQNNGLKRDNIALFKQRAEILLRCMLRYFLSKPTEHTLQSWYECLQQWCDADCDNHWNEIAAAFETMDTTAQQEYQEIVSWNQQHKELLIDIHARFSIWILFAYAKNGYKLLDIDQLKHQKCVIFMKEGLWNTYHCDEVMQLFLEQFVTLLTQYPEDYSEQWLIMTTYCSHSMLELIRQKCTTVTLHMYVRNMSMLADSPGGILDEFKHFVVTNILEYPLLEYLHRMLMSALYDIKPEDAIAKRNLRKNNNIIYCQSLPSPDELAHLPENTCIHIIRDESGFYDMRYLPEAHPNYTQM